MSNPELQQIARDATLQINCALGQLDWLRSTFHVIKDRIQSDPELAHYAKLADLALYNIEDWHNVLDCERETLENRLKAVEETSK
jgi:hypothetical protein